MFCLWNMDTFSSTHFAFLNSIAPIDINSIRKAFFVRSTRGNKCENVIIFLVENNANRPTI